MSKNNFSKDILRNPQFLHFKNNKSKGLKKRKSKLLGFLILLISIIPLTLLYCISIGFIIGGFNYVFNNLLSFNFELVYNLTMGFVGLALIWIAFFLSSLIIKYFKK